MDAADLLLRARRYVDEHPEDPRCVVFHRKDNYGRVCLSYPNPDGEGWLCPKCAQVTFTLYGPSLIFEDGRYSGTDERMCLDCFRSSPDYKSPTTRNGGQPNPGNP